jgi:hypothetical protein
MTSTPSYPAFLACSAQLAKSLMVWYTSGEDSSCGRGIERSERAIEYRRARYATAVSVLYITVAKKID